MLVVASAGLPLADEVLEVSPQVVAFFNGEYKRLHRPKAIAVSADGFHFGYSYCPERYGCRLTPSARDLAMQACAQSGGQRCRVFAVDDDIEIDYRVMNSAN